jgi:hypothetical protein
MVDAALDPGESALEVQVRPPERYGLADPATRVGQEEHERERAGRGAARRREERFELVRREHALARERAMPDSAPAPYPSPCQPPVGPRAR